MKNIKFKWTLKRNSLRTARNVCSKYQTIKINFLKISGLLSRFHRKYLVKIELKNCKISGNFGDLDILTDATVPETVETLVQKQPTTENRVTGLDYTAFMVNKESQSKCVMKIVNEFMQSLRIQSHDHMTPL